MTAKAFPLVKRDRNPLQAAQNRVRYFLQHVLATNPEQQKSVFSEPQSRKAAVNPRARPVPSGHPEGGPAPGLPVGAAGHASPWVSPMCISLRPGCCLLTRTSHESGRPKSSVTSASPADTCKDPFPRYAPIHRCWVDIHRSWEAGGSGGSPLRPLHTHCHPLPC